MPIVSQSSGRDDRAALFPGALLPLFNDAFVESFDLCEEYVARMALAVFESTGLERACQEDATVDQAVARAQLVPAIARVPTHWLLATLANRGWLRTSSNARGETLYRIGEPLPVLDPGDILRLQETVDPRCLPSYQIAALAAEHYPAVLRGQRTAEQALFGAEGLVTWVKYFSNGNPLYAVSNEVGAYAVQLALDADSAAILEIGGGLGSGAEALLARLESAPRPVRVSTYRFTEISPLFLKRAQRVLVTRHPACPFNFSQMDIDRPFAAQGIAPGAHSLAYGVNVLHVAHDLAATLAELKNALAPRGQLVLSECVRPFTGRPMHIEFVFNLLASFRDPLLVSGWRPNGGFLTAEQWSAALEANGFADVRIVPDIAAIRDAYPAISVAAIVARRT
jgi:SAM-dependent methyltransferase